MQMNILSITGVKARRNILIAYVSAYGYTKMAAERLLQEFVKQVILMLEIVDIENIDLNELESLINVS